MNLFNLMRDLWLLPVSAALLIGSFLGTVVTRLPAGRSPLIGRSACDACHHPLGVLDLVPLASWLVTGGRCRYCGTAVTAWYAVLELCAFGLTAWTATVYSGAALWIGSGLAWWLLALAVIDLREGVLPDILTLPLTAAGLAVTWLQSPQDILPHVIGAAGGLLALWVAGFLYRRLRGREGLGFGDAKLFAAAGAWISWWGLPSVLFIGSVATLVPALLLVRGRAESLSAVRIPFGPGLCLGLWLTWLYGPLG